MAKYLVLNGVELYTYFHADVLAIHAAEAVKIGETVGQIYKLVPSGLSAGKYVPITFEELRGDVK